MMILQGFPRSRGKCPKDKGPLPFAKPKTYDNRDRRGCPPRRETTNNHTTQHENHHSYPRNTNQNLYGCE